jgi:hypothetical protein
MRLTIIPSDKKVGVDELFFDNLDLAICAVPTNIHALQWYETDGEIEFINNPDRTKPQNELISELPVWASACVEKWNEAKTELEIQIALQKAEDEKRQPITTGIQAA